MNRPRSTSLSGSAVLVPILVLAWGGDPALGEGPTTDAPALSAGQVLPPLSRAKIHLAAGDYRRALEACQQEIQERPSAASYTFLTYVYHAPDGYLEHLSAHERWGTVEWVYWNLAYRDAQDLVDPPGGLARMAKEMIQESVRHQADMHAAMATRLDAAMTEGLWHQQKVWRESAPDRW